MKRLFATALLASVLSIPVQAQLIAAREAPVAMGHMHLNVSDLDEHKRFWVDVIGAEAGKLDTMEYVKYPNALIFLREQKPTDGTKGSSVNHIGIQFPDVPAMVAKVRAAGVPVVTKAEISRNRAKGDIFFSPSQYRYLAFIMGPDELKIEMFENRALKTPLANHHIHFAGQHDKKMQAWYAEMFGAKPMQRGIPSRQPTCPESTSPTLAPTRRKSPSRAACSTTSVSKSMTWKASAGSWNGKASSSTAPTSTCRAWVSRSPS